MRVVDGWRGEVGRYVYVTTLVLGMLAWLHRAAAD